MHTGGQPIRVIENGIPELQGATLLEKISFMKNNLDEYRKLLMSEQRGHYEMFGAMVVSSDIESCDLACIFIYNEGYATIYGDAVIFVLRYAMKQGLITLPETLVNIQCPSSVHVVPWMLTSHMTARASELSSSKLFRAFSSKQVNTIPG